jgi:hypothetical protein
MYSSYGSRGFGPSAPDLLDANDSRPMGPSSRHSAEQPAATKSSDNKYQPQLPTTSLNYVHLGAPDHQEESPSGAISGEEHNEPVLVQPVPMGRNTRDGPRKHVAGDEPQRAERHQAKPSPEGGNFVGAQPRSTLISPRT